MATGTALGAKLEYAVITGSSPSWTAAYTEIVNVGAFDFPLGTAEKLDTTTHASLKKAHAAGIIDGGTVQVPLVWDDSEASHEWVEDELHTKKQFRYTPKDGTATVFWAILKSLVAKNPMGTGPKERTLTLRISGGATAAEA
jgi:hypothetical protein